MWTREPSAIDAISLAETAPSECVFVAAGEARKRELQERYGFRVLDAASPGGVDA